MSSESNGVAEWLCPLCQKGQTDRPSLSLHLTEQHSVLPSCVDKLLDIVSTAVHYGLSSYGGSSPHRFYSLKGTT